MKKIISLILILLALNTSSNCIDANILVTNNLKDTMLNVGDLLELINKDFNQFKDIDGIETDGHVVFSPNRIAEDKALIIKVKSKTSPANKVLSSYLALKMMSSDIKTYTYSGYLKAYCILFKMNSQQESNATLTTLLSDYDVEITEDNSSCKSF